MYCHTSKNFTRSLIWGWNDMSGHITSGREYKNQAGLWNHTCQYMYDANGIWYPFSGKTIKKQLADGHVRFFLWKCCHMA